MKNSTYTKRPNKHKQLDQLMRLKAGDYITLPNTEHPERPAAKHTSYSYACNLAYAANMLTSPSTFTVRSISGGDQLRIVRLRDEDATTKVAPSVYGAREQTDAATPLWAVSFGPNTPTLIFSDQDIANAVAAELGDVTAAFKVL